MSTLASTKERVSTSNDPRDPTPVLLRPWMHAHVVWTPSNDRDPGGDEGARSHAQGGPEALRGPAGPGTDRGSIMMSSW